VQDAEANAAEDAKVLALAQARNAADGLVHSVKKTLAEAGDKVSAEDRGRIEAAIQTVEEALKGSDRDAIEAATNVLTESSHKLAETMYAQAGAGATGGDGHAAGGKDDGEVVDAEFTEVKGDQK
jgi:molecular chaperone DnaK